MSETWTVRAKNEAGTMRTARAVAPFVRARDVICLHGPLGAGKTVFARALIRALCDDEALEVPSPTFNLLLSYPAARLAVHHFDLYRLNSADELEELGWDDAISTGAIVVEWPDRAEGAIPEDRLDVHLLPGSGEEERELRLEGHGGWRQRLARARNVSCFLEAAGWAQARRAHLHGDASTRTYEKLEDVQGRKAILMNAPSQPDGPPIRGGRSYSAIAHLAENVRPFMAVAQGLRANGFSAPEIFAADADAGLLLLEDFGSETITAGDPPRPLEERYECAVDALSAMRGCVWPKSVTLPDGFTHKLRAYGRRAMSIEAELVLDWFAPFVGHTIRGHARRAFALALQNAFPQLGSGPQIWVLRDYHSPNIIWLPERDGIRRVGLIDFQDALIGHPAYDLVSLLQDARLDMPQALEKRLLERYLAAAAGEHGFDRDDFLAAYALLGAQRNTKILGIFARLAKRDGKPGYLRHLPRIAGYLARNLANPALAALAEWYDEHLPEALDPDLLARAA